MMLDWIGCFILLIYVSSSFSLAPLSWKKGQEQWNWVVPCVFFPLKCFLLGGEPLFLCHLVSLSISLFLSHSVSQSLLASVGWMMLIFLLLTSLHHYRSMLKFSFSSLLHECALLHSKPFDVNGNSWLREIWWKVSRPVFTPSQMALNKLGGKTQIHFSQKGLIQSTVSDGPVIAYNQRWLFQELFQSCLGIHILPLQANVKIENDSV